MCYREIPVDHPLQTGLLRIVELELHGIRSQKASIIDTAVKASQKAVVFHHTWKPCVDRLTDSDSAVTQLWNPITLRNPE
jgi:hypothetical protein